MAAQKVAYRRILAIEDIKSHSHYIAEHNLNAPLRFLDAVERMVELLCEYPEAGGVMPTRRTDASGLRAKLIIGFGNYVMLYFVNDEIIDIVRVIRGGLEVDEIALNAT